MGPVALTASMRRLLRLVGECVANKEPVLLVGETGCGKTTVCQLQALMKGQELHVCNLHQVSSWGREEGVSGGPGGGAQV